MIAKPQRRVTQATLVCWLRNLSNPHYHRGYQKFYMENASVDKLEFFIQTFPFKPAVF